MADVTTKRGVCLRPSVHTSLCRGDAPAMTSNATMLAVLLYLSLLYLPTVTRMNADFYALAQKSALILVTILVFSSEECCVSRARIHTLASTRHSCQNISVSIIFRNGHLIPHDAAHILNTLTKLCDTHTLIVCTCCANERCSSKNTPRTVVAETDRIDSPSIRTIGIIRSLF
ncbi:hypothetical protein EVAR_74336_1 [Eumeta japonica]|uniref:Uncharacterized protein n=1 Tax=Eumeta variegata TaxID=151549 RepID=A0A4C1SCT1_EUMVA|nr:hypothetical protein EVAR_74336_1 [Eumeta japonica]